MKMGKLVAFAELLSLLFAAVFFACKTDRTLAERTPFIQPPIPELNPAFTDFTFDAADGFTQILSSGTQIQIPPGALIDSTGNEITGLVNLRFREMKDGISIFLAGIPMRYREGNFSTAGTFEIRATQNGTPVFLKNGKNVEVRFASMTGGNDFDFFFLNEKNEGWDSLGTAKAEVNLEKMKLKKKIESLSATRRFPLDRQYFAFNYEALLDVFYGDQTPNFPKEQLKEKCAQYGLGWENAEIWDWIDFSGQKEHPAMMVWKNVHKKPFPEWVNTRQYGQLLPVKGNRYLYKVVNRQDTNVVFSVEIEVVMPLKTLFAFPPEKWKNEYEATMAKVRQEEERLKTMAEVYRTFQISGFGIYNWDKLMKEDEAVQLAATFNWNSEVNEKLSAMTVVFITGDNNGVINYPSSSWKNMALVPDKGGRLLAVLPGNKIALYPVKAYQKIDFEELKTRTLPEFVFDMQPKTIAPLTEEGFRKAVNF